MSEAAGGDVCITPITMPNTAIDGHCATRALHDDDEFGAVAIDVELMGAVSCRHTHISEPIRGYMVDCTK